jgi:hypothetical protein
MKKRALNVKGIPVTVVERHEQDYISLTDMVQGFEGGSAPIEQWLRNKDTVLFLGVWEQLNNAAFNSLEFEGIGNAAARNSFYHLARRKRTTQHWAYGTPAATPLGSNAFVVARMLNATTPSGSNSSPRSGTLHSTPKGSQLVEYERPHATTTPEGSQPVFRVSDRSGTPQGCDQPEEYSGERDPRRIWPRGTPNTSTSSV